MLNKQEYNREYQRQWRKNNPEKHRENQAKYRSTNPEAPKRWWRNQKRRYRGLILDHYGRICVRCGVSDERVLDLNHILRNGAEERRNNKKPNINKLVIDAGYPDTYNILCRNCNWIYYLENKDAE